MQLYEFKLLVATLMTDAEGHNTLFPAVVQDLCDLTREAERFSPQLCS